MKLKLIFLLISFSTILFGQNDSVVKKEKYFDRWQKLNERQDTVERKLPASQKTKDSISLEYVYNLNFTAGLWGFWYVKEPFLAEQTEITIGEWLNYIYYSDIKTNPIITTRSKLADSLKQRILKTPIDPTLLPTEEFIQKQENKDFFKKCVNCELIKIRSLDGFAYLPFESNMINSKSKIKKLKQSLNYPIAGISYEQVINFCKWRTSLDSLRYLTTIDTVGMITSPGLESHIFRLPTEEEFDKLNLQFDSIVNSQKRLAHFNYKSAKYSNKESEQNKDYGNKSTSSYDYFLTKAEKQLKTKKKLLYNIQGNVAEMTTTKGIAKGGSYHHFAKDSNLGTKNYYEKPELWLGFRCVVVRRKP